VLIDLEAKDKPVAFVSPGRGKDTGSRPFLAEHGGRTQPMVEVVCDMSGAFLAAIDGPSIIRRHHRRLIPRRAEVDQGCR
jgi:hypothetical protein